MAVLPGQTVALGNPPTSTHQVDTVELAAWMTYIEGLAGGSISYIEDDLSDLPTASGVTNGAFALVLNDATEANRGVYKEVSDAWVKQADLPPGYVSTDPVILTVGGTANAITATANRAFQSGALAETFTMQIAAANTGAVTVAIDGGTARALVTSAGDALTSGYLAEDSIVDFRYDGTSYRLTSSATAAGAVAAAAASAAAALASENAAATSESNAADSETAAAASESRAAASATVAGAAAGFFDFADVATLVADTDLTYTTGQDETVSAGSVIRTRTEGFSYIVAASGATDHALTTAGGVKLKPVPLYAGKPTYNLAMFNVAPTASSVQDRINAVLQYMPTYSKLILPAGTYTIAKATVGTVTAGSSGTNSGVIGAIYLDKEGQELEGVGYGTHLDGNNGAMDCIAVRASHCRVQRLRAGNVAGQLTTGESAGVTFSPSNFVQGSDTGVDIEDLIVSDCDFYDCDSGVSGRPEMDFLSPTNKLHLSAKLIVENCRIIGYRRQCVELFQCHDSWVDKVFAIGADLGSYSVTRFVRIIGSDRAKVTNCDATGFDSTDSGNWAIEISTSGFYGNPDFYGSSQDALIQGNRFHNYYQDMNIQESRGTIQFLDNICTCDDDAGAHFMVRVETNGISNPAGASNLANKKTCDGLVIEGNRSMGKSRAVIVNGRVGHMRVANNVTVCNAATDAGLINILMQGSVDTDIADLESVGFCDIDGNTTIVSGSSTGGDIRIENLKSGDHIEIASHRTTAAAGYGLVLVGGGGDGNIYVASPTAISNAPSSIWTRDFDTPRTQQWTGN